MDCPYCLRPIKRAARHRVTVDWFELPEPERGGPTLLTELVPRAGFNAEIVTCQHCQMFEVTTYEPGVGAGQAVLHWGPAMATLTETGRPTAEDAAALERARERLRKPPEPEPEDTPESLKAEIRVYLDELRAKATDALDGMEAGELEGAQSTIDEMSDLMGLLSMTSHQLDAREPALWQAPEDGEVN